MIRFLCYLLCLIFSWVVLCGWSFIFSASGPEKIEVSSLAPKHIINPDELWFLIGLPTDWQSPIGPLCSNQAEWLHLRHSSCIIFLFSILLHWCYRIGDVFNMKRSPYDFHFCLIYAGISSVGNWAFFNPIKILQSCSDWSWLPPFNTEW
jgi:hypothetical protein